MFQFLPLGGQNPIQVAGEMMGTSRAARRRVRGLSRVGAVSQILKHGVWSKNSVVGAKPSPTKMANRMVIRPFNVFLLLLLSDE